MYLRDKLLEGEFGCITSVAVSVEDVMDRYLQKIGYGCRENEVYGRSWKRVVGIVVVELYQNHNNGEWERCGVDMG